LYQQKKLDLNDKSISVLASKQARFRTFQTFFLGQLARDRSPALPTTSSQPADRLGPPQRPPDHFQDSDEQQNRSGIIKCPNFVFIPFALLNF
jgi:hypothetical protein